MARMWIVVGDMTDSGGRVLTGSPFTDIDGQSVSRVNDQAFCPKHRGVFPIVDGDPTTIIDGWPVALHGSSLACGCKVLAVRQARVFNDEGTAAAAAALTAGSPPASQGSPASPQASFASSTGQAPGLDDYTLHYHYGDLDQTPVRGVSYQVTLADDSVRTGQLDDGGKANLGNVSVGPVQVVYQHETDDGDDEQIRAARQQIQDALDAIVAQTRRDFAEQWQQWNNAGFVKREALKLGNQGLGAVQGAWDYASGTIEMVWQFAVALYKADREIQEWKQLLLTGDRKGLDRKIADYRVQGKRVMAAASEMKELFNLLIDDPAIVILLPAFAEEWWTAIPPDEQENIKARYSSQIILDVVVSIVLAAVTIETGGAGGFGYAAAKAGSTAARVGSKVMRLLEDVEDAFRALAKALRKRKRRMAEGDKTPDGKKQLETRWQPRRMPEKKVPCFSPQKLPASKYPEMDRQLAGQQQGLNDMTVQEYLDARKAFDPKNRSSKVASTARTDFRTRTYRERLQELQLEGYSSTEAKRLANAHANETMKTMHALHNPDLVAGGKDMISDFGDGEVNSTIGRQWKGAKKGGKTRVQEIDEAAMKIPPGERRTTKMNGKLERCR